MDTPDVDPAWVTDDAIDDVERRRREEEMLVQAQRTRDGELGDPACRC